MPDDTSPHGGEAMHPLPDRAKIPQPKPGADEAAREVPRPQEPELKQRPPLPEHPERTAVDIEDEEADPVQESGPGVANDTGKPSPVRQPGG